MKICPNCAKKLNERFEYCNACGSKLDGEFAGDFRTDIRNLFKNEDGYYYIYPVCGIQQIILSCDIDDIRAKVMERKFPWPSAKKGNGRRKINSEMIHKSDFLKISEQNSQVINRGFNYSEFKKSQRAKVTIQKSDTIDKVAETPQMPKLVPDEELPRQFGVIGLFREKYGGLDQWAFKNNETPYAIRNPRLDDLKREVISRELHWEVIDEALESEAYNLDTQLFDRRQAEILEKRTERRVSLEDKIKLKKEMGAKRAPAYMDMDKIRW